LQPGARVGGLNSLAAVENRQAPSNLTIELR
jgi:hypothetical protein